MKKINKNTKRLDKIETFEVKTSDGRGIRVLYDIESKQVELIVDHSILSKCNQGVKSEVELERECQPYVIVSGFYQD